VSKLVLLKKKKGNISDPKIYRPICLLNESAKLFERIIAGRINKYLRDSGSLSENQFGFMEGRSTIDAIMRLKDIVLENSLMGRNVVLVSFDIANAFNSISWPVIQEALLEMNFPSYLVRIIMAYLSDRWLTYIDYDGKYREKEITRGVPQGSVLGPILWNIGYNKILKTRIEKDSDILCYADDTILIATGDSIELAIHNANIDSCRIVRAIESLGLEVAAHKTQAMNFYCKNKPINKYIIIKNKSIDITDKIIYLGLTIDCKWSFFPHFQVISTKVDRIIGYLAKIMPNAHGPDESKRKLYM
jgi:hypothetical protein